MNGIIITVLLIGGLLVGVGALENCVALNRWLEKQKWWKEIVG